ncbi:MAG: glycosyltransferase family 4 protein [Planctomycetota bacterium]
MRILFLTENFYPEMNASATRVYERAWYWVRWGHEVTVVTTAPNFPMGRVFPGYENRWRQVETLDGIRVVRVKTYMSPNKGTVRRTLDFSSFLFMGLAGALGEGKPDVVAATSPQFFAAVAGWLASIFKNRPFVFELGDLWPASISAVGAMQENTLLRCMERLELFLYRRSAAIVALTDAFQKNLVQRGIPPEKIKVVRNGVDLPRYSPRPRNASLAREWGIDDRFTVGYLGTLGMAHALEKVLDAAELLKNHEDIRFLFVGPGAARDGLVAESQARRLGNVIFIPPQPKENMPEYWSLCDAALVHLKDSPVFASVIPSKIFEAMGMGKPILLAAPQGEASQIVEGEEAGLCLPPEDPNALAQAVLRLKEDAGLHRRLSQASLAAAPKYTREKQARDMLSVLEIASRDQGKRMGETVKP